MSQDTLKAVRAWMLGRLAHLACKKLVPLRGIRIRRMQQRLAAIEKVLAG